MSEKAERKEAPNADRGRSDFLAMLIGIGLMTVLPAWELLPQAEAALVGWSVASAVGYWLPPRPSKSYARWMLESLTLVIAFYLAYFKAPVWLKHWVPGVLAYGIPLLTFFALFIVWIRRSDRKGEPNDSFNWSAN